MTLLLPILGNDLATNLGNGLTVTNLGNDLATNLGNGLADTTFR